MRECVGADAGRRLRRADEQHVAFGTVVEPFHLPEFNATAADGFVLGEFLNVISHFVIAENGNNDRAGFVAKSFGRPFEVLGEVEEERGFDSD